MSFFSSLVLVITAFSLGVVIGSDSTFRFTIGVMLPDKKRTRRKRTAKRAISKKERRLRSRNAKRQKRAGGRFA